MKRSKGRTALFLTMGSLLLVLLTAPAASSDPGHATSLDAENDCYQACGQCVGNCNGDNSCQQNCYTIKNLCCQAAGRPGTTTSSCICQ